MRAALATLIALVLAPGPAVGEFDGWDLGEADASLVTRFGRPCLELRRGHVPVPGVEFRNGVIEYDIAFTGERGFVGAAWRVESELDFEHFYLRPHQSGNPDACQYTPVIHGSSAWQLVTDGGAAVDLPTERWIGVRIEVWEDSFRVQLDGRDVPLTPRLAATVERGGVALVVPGYAPAWFSNVRARAIDARPASWSEEVEPALDPGFVATWDVSTAFAESELSGQRWLERARCEELDWAGVDAGPDGIANLARRQGAAPGADTCLARTVIASGEARLAQLEFGFSDRVRVYLNGVLLYAGDDTYRSRDYRFLGTIGLHDRLFLPLEEGDNELVFAVSESFGGWGLIARVQ